MKLNKFQDFVKESLSNFSNVRKWDKRPDGSLDKYITYRLTKAELGKYLNTWFDGSYGKSDITITLKEVDEQTAKHLYGHKFNPISISILPAYVKGEDLYQMKLQIQSIDDSSYGIWWEDRNLQDLKDIRSEIMAHINTLSVVNGEQLLEYCITKDADPSSKDYD